MISWSLPGYQATRLPGYQAAKSDDSPGTAWKWPHDFVISWRFEGVMLSLTFHRVLRLPNTAFRPPLRVISQQTLTASMSDASICRFSNPSQCSGQFSNIWQFKHVSLILQSKSANSTSATLHTNSASCAPRSEPRALLCWRLYLNCFRIRKWKTSENECRQKHSSIIETKIDQEQYWIKIV